MHVFDFGGKKMHVLTLGEKKMHVLTRGEKKMFCLAQVYRGKCHIHFVALMCLFLLKSLLVNGNPLAS
jgi:hypothetical protein